MTIPDAPMDWTEANQRLLAAELALLRQLLAGGTEDEAGDALSTARDAARDAMPSPSAIDLIATSFELSDFERSLLLLCCGVELDAGLGQACAHVQGDPAARNPTFGLALSLLPGAHWSALTPARPLRHWRLLELEPGGRLVDSPLRVDERILHFIAGINLMDARIRPLLSQHPLPAMMSATQAELAQRLAIRLAGDTREPVQLGGNDPAGQRDVFAAAAAVHQCQAFVLDGDELPSGSLELETLQVLWEREARLLPAFLLVQVADTGPSAPLLRFAESLRTPLFIAARDPLRLRRAFTAWTVDKPAPAEQRQLWQVALGDRAQALNGSLDALAGQFRLSTHSILDIAGAQTDGSDGTLWQACRHLGRERLDDLAQRIEPLSTWEDLILPPAPQNALRQVAAHLRQRIRVYEDWGFARSGNRGLGVSALFCGESGTGKTLAAEVLANELQLDLYRIDLSAVVSKYIGETEKNLRRVFDAAEDSGAILLFDEADALFGKRSEVKDSHDRYANIEVSYLLQRMEAYRGLAILTSNMRSALDRAFQRRLRFIVNFPFPDSSLREAIWRRAFPPQAPLRDIEYGKLARLNLPGGSIRNIALNAAFLAAESREPVGMPHILRAAQSESGKLERPLAEAETRGWV